MDRTERFYKIERMLRNRQIVPIQDFLNELDVSIATFKRDIEYLRERLNAPIPWDREKRGYRLYDPDSKNPRHELPGLWFNSSEIHALLAFHHLLDRLQSGLLTPHIAPLKKRIHALIEKDDHSFDEIAQRIHVLPQAARHVESPCFQSISHALLSRRRLRLVHYHRGRDEETTREVSPQRLIHYRDNWYLDAWDHGKQSLRTFAVDSIRHAVLLDIKARNIPNKTLNAELGNGYGIFAGRKTLKAVLRFTPERARWITSEQWHPKQRGWFEDGYYLLEIPYSDDREMLMDILKYGPDVEVIAPAPLRRKVAERLRLATQRYNDMEKNQ
jgi:predicted DNA-binding transcriptional regulator YafY